MYTKILVPLDGSAVAEQVLPYVRTLAGGLKIPVELMGVVDVAQLDSHIAAEKGRYLDTLIEDSVRSQWRIPKRSCSDIPLCQRQLCGREGRSCGGYHCQGRSGQRNAYHHGNAWPFGN